MNSNIKQSPPGLTVCEAVGATGILAFAAFGLVTVFGVLALCEVAKNINSKFKRN